jgi:hypothetical protein
MASRINILFVLERPMAMLDAGSREGLRTERRFVAGGAQQPQGAGSARCITTAARRGVEDGGGVLIGPEEVAHARWGDFVCAMTLLLVQVPSIDPGPPTSALPS